MKISASLIEEAHLALRKIISGWGKRVAKSQGVTLREGIATVTRRITVGAGGAGATVGLYAVATADDHEGTSYTHYLGDDGKYYVHDHTEDKTYSV